jgi:hypothetical protein
MLSVPPPLLGASGGWGRDGEGVMPQATHFDGLLLSGLGCWLGRGPSEQATNRAGGVPPQRSWWREDFVVTSTA